MIARPCLCMRPHIFLVFANCGTYLLRHVVQLHRMKSTVFGMAQCLALIWAGSLQAFTRKIIHSPAHTRHTCHTVALQPPSSAMGSFQAGCQYPAVGKTFSQSSPTPIEVYRRVVRIVRISAPYGSEQIEFTGSICAMVRSSIRCLFQVCKVQ